MRTNAIIFIIMLAINFAAYPSLAQNKAGAKTTRSDATGSWCNSATWDNGIPDEVKDVIIIHGGDTVDARCVSNLVIGSSATLVLTDCSILIANDMEFANGSSVLVEDCAALIINGNLVNRNNSDNVVINGSLEVGGGIDNGNNSAISGTGTITADSITGYCCVMGMDPDTIAIPAYISDSVQGGSLPVELLAFNVACNDGEEIVSWSTASETNNAYFTLYCIDDMYSASEIARVAGSGNSNMVVEYSLEIGASECSDYYELTQTDFDGSTSIVAIARSCYKNNTHYSMAHNGDAVTFYGGVKPILVFSTNGAAAACRIFENTVYFYNAGVFFIRLSNGDTIKTVVYP